MFKHILVPVDLTDRCQKAMEIAVDMATKDDGKITLLHIIETIGDADSEDFRKFFRQIGNRADKQMSRMLEEYRREGMVMEKQVLYGKRVHEILHFAEHNWVDLIIMSSHKLDMENAGEGWGTISYKVGILSHCPVMLVK